METQDPHRWRNCIYGGLTLRYTDFQLCSGSTTQPTLFKGQYVRKPPREACRGDGKVRFFLIRKKCSIGPGPKEGNPVFLCNKLPQTTIDITSQRWGGSGSQSGLAGQCWRRVFPWRPSPRQSRCQQGCTWWSPWGGRTPCQQLTPQAGELVLADRGRLQFLSTWASPMTARASSGRGWVSTCAVHEGESGRGHPCPDPGWGHPRLGHLSHLV